MKFLSFFIASFYNRVKKVKIGDEMSYPPFLGLIYTIVEKILFSRVQLYKGRKSLLRELEAVFKGW